MVFSILCCIFTSLVILVYMYNVKVVSSSKRVFLLKILTIVASILPPDRRPTSSELEMLSLFLDLPDEKFHYNRFGAKARKLVASQFLSSRTAIVGVANRLQALVRKGFLRRDEDNVLYPSKLLTQIMNAHSTSKGFSVTFNFYHEDIEVERPNA